MPRASAVAALTLAVLVASGCDDAADDAPSSGSTGAGFSCKLAFAGDPDAPIELELVTRGAELVSTDLAEGGPAPMILPPQGGRVILVGVRATNIDPCGVELSGSIREEATGQVRLDQRTTNLGPKGTFAESIPEDISTYANIPTCPNQWASVDVHESLFEVTVSVTDRRGKTASKTLHAAPFCSEPENEAECLCKCQAGYVLGQTCP